VIFLSQDDNPKRVNPIFTSGESGRDS
jgi:hypothetical protein